MKVRFILGALVLAATVPTVGVAKPGVPVRLAAGEASRLLGYAVFGDADDVAALEKDLAPLASVGVKTARPKTSDGRTELLILFTEGVGPISAELVRQKVSDGKLGKFELESILAPESAVK
ncbi:hypothetical protein C7W88_14125 [Novosphingobium sp. THN1]|uniref:hypothetical protein n=1 Tax=Novosphingobium sp. THN1 TaxID=1016987 RepID=UPI000E48EFA2|nr:hypothetical protein [Novosphingobium sp. THN1]AXU19907.1 hypothetical protein C7W88_14125 [Novosphingobium sp. THN1]